MLISSFTSQIINTWPNRKLLNYRYFEQIRDIMPSILLSVFMGIVVWLVGLISMPVVIKLFVQIICGIGVYISVSVIVKIEPFVYLMSIIEPKMKRKNEME